MGDLDGALADFNQAVVLKPDLADAFYGLGAKQSMPKAMRRPRSPYTKSIELDPGKSVVWHSRGCLHYDNHEFADAATDFRKAIQLDENMEYSRFRLWFGPCAKPDR